MLLILVLCGCALTFIAALAGACDYVKSEFDTGILIFLLVIFSIYAWLHAWFISIVYQTFVNLREKSHYIRNLNLRSIRNGKVITPDIFFTETPTPTDNLPVETVEEESEEATVRPVYPNSFMSTFTLDRNATIKMKQPKIDSVQHTSNS